MSDFQIPQQYQDGSKTIRQVNRGDALGELWGTFNIDLTTSPGKIRVGKLLKKVLDDSDLESGYIQAIVIHGGSYYAIGTDVVLSCSTLADPTDADNWSEAGTLGSEDLGFESDGVSFDGKLRISLGTDIMSWDGSTKDDDWWTNVAGGAALTEDFVHTLHTHRAGTDTLFVTDKNLIRYYNTAAGHSAITLDDSFVACCVASGIRAVWVGTYTEIGDRAYVYEVYVGEQLDGTPVARQAYPVDGRAVLSIDVIENTPYIVTEKGVIQAFNGVGFTTVAHFPFAYQQKALSGVRPGLVQNTSISRPIHPKGMRARGESFLIALDASDSENLPVDERTPSGLWEFNTQTGVLNHRQAIGNSGEHGQHQLRRSGPVLVVDNPYTLALVGSAVTESGFDGQGLFGDDNDSAPYGYFITPEIESQVTQDTYEKVVMKARTMGVDESVVLKWRTSKGATYPQYNDIVWLNANQFTTTDVSFVNAQAGHEIEIVDGYKAGHLAHITAIETSSSTYTVTIDEELGSLNETSIVRLENWTKSKEAYTADDGEVKQIGNGKVNPWVQYKVVLQGDIELREFRSKGNAKE